VTESERAHAEVQMLFGVHVFGLAKVVPDLALLRGEEAYRAARTVGESTVEFQSALGLTRIHLELGDVASASTWLEHAAQSCRDAPGPLRALQLESWRGRVGAASGDASAMRLHLLRSLELATNQGRAAARCEALATLALEAARMGVEGADEDLLELAERSAVDAIEIALTLTGRPPWTWQASAARGSVHLARGDTDAAVASARASLSGLLGSHVEDLHFEIVLPVAEILAAGGTDDEKARMLTFLQMQVALFAQRVADDTIRSRWLRGPVGARLVALAGPLEGAPSQSVPGVVAAQPEDGGAAPDGAVQPLDVAILRQMTQGATNGEIAAALGVSVPEVAQRIAGMAAQLGSTSRADATLYAFGMV
jgi:DNA-binding CsgD family transcriptional regulator